MVRFGGYKLQHVSDVKLSNARVIQERVIPTAQFGHRRDETADGQSIALTGEIRGDPDYVLRLEELRRRADNIPRELDLEDGSGPIIAKLGSITMIWDVERGVDRVIYTLNFYEAAD